MGPPAVPAHSLGGVTRPQQGEEHPDRVRGLSGIRRQNQESREAKEVSVPGRVAEKRRCVRQLRGSAVARAFSAVRSLHVRKLLRLERTSKKQQAEESSEFTRAGK